MKKIILIISIFFNLYSVVNADTLKNKEEVGKLAMTVMDLVAKGETKKGMLLTKPYLIIPDHEFKGMLNSYKMQKALIEQRFGKTISTELANIEEVGNSLMLITYLQKFEKHIMRWKFYFYKPKNVWVLNTFKTDDKIQLMFKDSKC